MKPLTAVLAGSLFANIFLFAAWYLKPSPPAAAPDVARQLVEAEDPGADLGASAIEEGNLDQPLVGAGPIATDTPDTATWDASPDEDLHAFAARLRARGLPARAVRSLVSAEIDRRFSEREKALLPHQRARPRYWETGPPREPLETKLARLDLRREKMELLSSVLGVDVSSLGGAFDSPIAPEKRDLVRLITQDYEAMISEIRGIPGGLLLESEKEALTYIEAERRRDLAAILTPEELADYEMTQSNTFRALRHQLAGFQATEEEFRLIYEVQRDLDDRFRPDPGVRRMPSPEERQAELAARAASDAQLRAALGDARFGDYERGRDREYQQIHALVQRMNLPVEAAIEVFAVRGQVSAESNRIANDSSLDIDQKVAALAALAQGARAQIRSRLPGEAGEAYLNVAEGWLGRVEDGGAITFGPNSTSVRMIRRRPPPNPRPPGG